MIFDPSGQLCLSPPNFIFCALCVTYRPVGKFANQTVVKYRSSIYISNESEAVFLICELTDFEYYSPDPHWKFWCLKSVSGSLVGLYDPRIALSKYDHHQRIQHGAKI